jgi:23S rRNA (uridine2479-2'-O)-methyltransferase
MTDGREERTKVLRVGSRNQWFQRILALKENREKRLHYRQFVVEGVRSINALRRNPEWEVSALLYPHETGLSNWAREVLDEMRAGCHLACDRALMTELSDKEDTSEVMAVVEMPVIDGRRLPLGSNDIAVVVDRPGNPGNLGSIIRSCDALGHCGIVLVGHGVDPFDPVVIRAAAGSFFNVSIARLQARADFSAWVDSLREDCPNLRIVGTSAHGDTEPWRADFSRPTILLIGNETYGLSAWLKQRCDIMLRIDMTGTASSLNVACAATAFLYEIHRQRHSKSHIEHHVGMEYRL